MIRLLFLIVLLRSVNGQEASARCSHTSMTIQIKTPLTFDGAVAIMHKTPSFIKCDDAFTHIGDVHRKVVPLVVNPRNCIGTLRIKALKNETVTYQLHVLVKQMAGVVLPSDVVYSFVCVAEGLASYRKYSARYLDEEFGKPEVDSPVTMNVLDPGEGHVTRWHVRVGEKLVVAFGISDTSSANSTKVESCTAYSNPKEDITKRAAYNTLLLLDDGCPSVEALTIVSPPRPHPTDASKTLLPFVGFRFTSSAALHIHCTVVVCESSNDTLCELPDCSKNPPKPDREERSLSISDSDAETAQVYTSLKVTIGKREQIFHRQPAKTAEPQPQTECAMDTTFIGTVVVLGTLILITVAVAMCLFKSSFNRGTFNMEMEVYEMKYGVKNMAYE